MTTMSSSPVSIQTSPQSLPSTPPWFEEVAGIAHTLQRLGVLSSLEERVRFARRGFGHYSSLELLPRLREGTIMCLFCS